MLPLFCLAAPWPIPLPTPQKPPTPPLHMGVVSDPAPMTWREKGPNTHRHLPHRAQAVLSVTRGQAITAELFCQFRTTTLEQSVYG